MDLLNRRAAAVSTGGALLPAAVLLVAVFAFLGLTAGDACAVGDTLDIPLFEPFGVPSPPGWVMNGQWHVTLAPDTVDIIPAIRDSLISLISTTTWPAPPEGVGYLIMSGESTGTYIAPWDPLLQSAGNGGASTAPHADTVYTPLIQMSSSKLATLSFKTWFEVEGYDFRTRDKMVVAYSNDGGLSFTPLGEMADTLAESPDPAVAYSSGGLDADGIWIDKKYEGIAPSPSGFLQFRFTFRTGDSLRNGFRGWAIDELAIRCDSLYPPYDFAASDTLCDGIFLSWNDSSGAGGITYELFRRDMISMVLDTITVGAGLTFFDTLVIPGTPYEYSVHGITVCGSSGPSPIDLGQVPPMPMNPGTVFASESTCGAVNLEWIPVPPFGDRIEVFRDSVLLDTLPGDAGLYDDSTAAPGVKYEYNVAAVGACDTAWSMPDSGSAIALPPGVAFVSATDGRCDDVKVTWIDPGGALDYFVVYREPDSLAAVHPDSTLEYFDTGIDSMVAYLYSVRTRNSCGLSDTIGTDTGTRTGLPPSAASCSATDNLCSEVVVTWVPSSDPGVTDGFVVRRDEDSLGYVDADSAAVFRDSSATVDSAHIYTVEARNSCGGSVELCADTGIVGEPPPTPHPAEASDTLCDHVMVEWNSTDGEFLFYVVYRDGDSIGAVERGAPTMFADSLVDSATVSSYKLQTRSSCGASAFGGADNGMRLGLPPTPEACVASDNLCGRVTVAWIDTIPGAIDRYIVSRDSVPIDTLFSPPFQLTDNAATANVAHDYEVTAWNDCGRSLGTCADSGMALTAPGPPQSFTASQEGCGEVELAWEAPVTGGPVSGYRLVRGSPPVTTQLGPDVFQYVDVPSDTVVVYTLRAYNCEESAGVVDTGRTVGSIPMPPANCSAELLDCETLRISWTAAPSANEGYVVIRDGAIRVDSVGSGVFSVDDAPPQDGVDYGYDIYALNACGSSVEACGTSGRIPGPIGAPPAGSCEATDDSCDGVHLAWQRPDEEQDVWWFKIYRLPGNDLLDSLGGAESTWVDTEIAHGDSSTYAIVAGNPCHVSAAACTVHGERRPLPSAPQNCSATSDLCGKVRLDWTMASSGVEEGIFQFKIYRKLSQSSGNFTLHATVTASIGANSWDDTQVEPLRTYLYRIASVNKCGETVGSCQVQGSIITVKPAPTLASPASGASDLDLPLDLTWNSVSGVTGYRVEVAPGAAFDTLAIDTTLNNLALSVDDIEFDTTYFWRVRSVNACGGGNPSNARTFTLGVAPGVELIGGSPQLLFGNESDTLFADSTFVIQNMGKDTLDWLIDPDPDWIAFEPASGTLPGGDSVSITAGVAEWKCGQPFADTMIVIIDPPREGRVPVTLYGTLLPPPRPAGDYDWDCTAGIDDAGSILDALLGLAVPDAEDSTGADANGDGRITVADLVLLGNTLAAGAIGKSTGGAPVEFSLGGEEGLTLTMRSSEPVRALRLKAALDGGMTAEAVDGASTLLLRDEAAGTISLFWYGANGGDGAGETEIDLVKLGGGEEAAPAKSGPVAVRPLAVELLGTGGDVWRPAVDGASLVPAEIPSRLAIIAVRPNPFNAFTTIEYAMPEEGRVQIDLFDIRGARVATLLDAARPAGPHQATWNGETDAGRPAATGLYFVRVRAAGDEVTSRLTLLR